MPKTKRIKISSTHRIAILGAGTMGLSIGQVAALAGFDVIIYDISAASLEVATSTITRQLEKSVRKQKITEKEKVAAINRITACSEFGDLIAELFVEAVVEDIDVKADLLDQIQKKNPSAVLVTNTSSIPVTQLASRISDPSRLVGMHFFNPAHIMKLVEVIPGAATNPLITDAIFDLAKQMGKIPVKTKDSPGFIVNRVARHFYVESLKTLDERVSDCSSIDKLMRSIGFRMGPFELMDLIGVDTNLAVTKTIFEQFNQEGRFRPSRFQQQMVSAGYNGKKSGRGFYMYP